MSEHHDSNLVVRAVRPYVPPIDQFPLVINFAKSHGAFLFDEASMSHKIDFAGSYASMPLGYNHPAMTTPEFERELVEVSRVRIANLDVLCEPYARFLETFVRVAGAGFTKYFFVDGGALGVENAMKAAFDWKVRRNLAAGRGERGHEILHFRQAFHGRGGYTLSVTNTADPNKTKHFPKFPWPRVTNPKCHFPLEGDHLDQTLQGERAAMNEIEHAFAAKRDDIAAILIEPIQSEGGDNHFRPEFLRFLRETADANDCLLIFDEVQTGMGLTGDMWAWQTLGVRPDIVCFAKKAQVGGFMAGERLLAEPHNVFVVPSRISSTWGASLTDMVRCRKYLEIYESENILENVRARGAELIRHLHAIADDLECIENVRGRGLMAAFDLVYPEMRNELLAALERNGLLLLPCGEKSVRFRPHLNVTREVIGKAMDILAATLEASLPSEPVHSS